jgi:hypothetical protein
MRKRASFVVALPVAAALLLSSCASTRIGRIRADPTRFQNKEVRVNGTVTNSYGALIAGAYEIQDETGKIYVISNTGVPSKGSQVTVQGTVINGVTLGGRSYGTAIREYRHKVR